MVEGRQESSWQHLGPGLGPGVVTDSILIPLAHLHSLPQFSPCGQSSASVTLAHVQSSSGFWEESA